MGKNVNVPCMVKENISEDGMSVYTRMERRLAAYRLSPVNALIIIINTAVFICLRVMGDPSNAWFMYEHGASWWPAVFTDHEYYRLLTCAFMHFSLAHLFNNMLVLYGIGYNLEHALGGIRYTIFYLICAVSSSLVSAVWNSVTGDMAVSAGASGAIFGVVGGMLIILLRNRGHLEDLSAGQVILYIILSVYLGINSVGVDNAAHIGGFITGAVLGFVLYRRGRRRSSRRRNTGY